MIAGAFSALLWSGEACERDGLILTELRAREADELGAGGDAEFHEHVSEVVGDRTRTDEELCRAFLVCRTLGDTAYDLQLLRRELVESALFRAVSPVARSSDRARSSQGAAPSRSKMSSALRS